MASNRFFTLLLIPESSSQVRKLVIPGWMLRGSIAILAFLLVLSGMMVFNYFYLLSQIGENRDLRLENRRLKQQVQVFQTKISSIESTMERVKTFTARLKVITNVEDRENLIQSLNDKIPDAATNIAATTPLEIPAPGLASSADTTTEARTPLISETFEDGPEAQKLEEEYRELDGRLAQLDHQALYVEQVLQDQYALLADQKAFLAALPTRKPAVGYFTSGFGVRRSPFGGRDKMHEGLDIANQPGTPIKATADGLVVFADTKAGYGQTVIIDHGYGLETWYAHNRRLTVTKGQKVKRGDPISQLGNSGRSTGPHLHYEVRVHGTPVDPLTYILEN
jgi:murein DD-endopeptidase MepM/ murein hydrolase activator NlpD